MNYEIVNCEEKTFVGLSDRTANDDPNCGKIVGDLWNRFFNEGVFTGIKNKANAFTVGHYCNYGETSFDVTVGCEVTQSANPELVERTAPAGRYAVFHIKGNVVTDVANAWNEIWSMPLERSFTADYEEYLTSDVNNAEIKIYVALK